MSDSESGDEEEAVARPQVDEEVSEEEEEEEAPRKGVPRSPDSCPPVSPWLSEALVHGIHRRTARHTCAKLEMSASTPACGN